MFFMIYFVESCRPNALLRQPEIVESLYYPCSFHVLILSLNNCEMENEKSRNMGVCGKGFFWVAFRSTLLVGTYYILIISSKILFI